MKSITIIVLLVYTASGQIQCTTNFQGMMIDAQVSLVPNGNHQLPLIPYDQAARGNQVITENRTVPVIKGIFDVVIGCDCIDCIALFSSHTLRNE